MNENVLTGKGKFRRYLLRGRGLWKSNSKYEKETGGLGRELWKENNKCYEHYFRVLDQQNLVKLDVHHMKREKFMTI